MAARAAAGPGRPGLADRRGFIAGVFLFPAVAYLVALVAVPVVLAAVLAFADAGAAGPVTGPYGPRAFTSVLRDEVFWRSLGATLLVTAASTAVAVVCGAGVAGLMRADFRGKWLARLFLLLPWTTPVALSATSWRWLLGAPGSPAGRILRGAGVLPGGVSWAGRPAVALGSVTAVHAWRLTPLVAVIIAAGLARVPRDLRDAARVDGAGPLRRAFGVTIPLVLPVIAIAALLAAVITATDMTVAYVLTGGGPGGATEVLPTLAYARGAQGGAAGRAAAIALLSLPLPLAAVFGLIRAGRRE